MMGDQLLIELSRRMRDTMRDGDTLARLGGDEFIAVLEGLFSKEECIRTIRVFFHSLI